jgi:hypothetical protein
VNKNIVDNKLFRNLKNKENVLSVAESGIAYATTQSLQRSPGTIAATPRDDERVHSFSFMDCFFRAASAMKAATALTAVFSEVIGIYCDRAGEKGGYARSGFFFN